MYVHEYPEANIHSSLEKGKAGTGGGAMKDGGGGGWRVVGGGEGEGYARSVERLTHHVLPTHESAQVA